MTNKLSCQSLINQLLSLRIHFWVWLMCQRLRVNRHTIFSTERVLKTQMKPKLRTPQTSKAHFLKHRIQEQVDFLACKTNKKLQSLQEEPCSELHLLKKRATHFLEVKQRRKVAHYLVDQLKVVACSVVKNKVVLVCFQIQSRLAQTIFSQQTITNLQEDRSLEVHQLVAPSSAPKTVSLAIRQRTFLQNQRIRQQNKMKRMMMECTVMMKMKSRQ